MSTGKKRIIKYKCPYCDDRYTKVDLVPHVGEVHEDYIPEGYTPLRVVFDYVNKRPAGYNGKCTECGGPTGWDENKGRYNRQCSNPKCKESYVKKFEKNMKDKLGVERISSTVEGQEKMLANRKISGKYKFQDGGEKTYTGKYEKSTLEFLDKVMNCSSADVITPGPVIEYTYKKQKHFYISDIYYQPYNLVIEVKDGGDNPNNRDMKEYREKQIEKERALIKNTDYNYIRLTNNDLSQLMSVFAELKMELVDNTNDRVIDINESKDYLSEAMNALLGGYMPGLKDTQSVYIVNYLQNNVFSGHEEMNYAISDNIGLTNLICRDREGVLRKAPKKLLERAQYVVYKVPGITPQEVSDKLAPYMNTFVEYGFLYETVTGNKLYTDDQFFYDPKLQECVTPKEYIGMKCEILENILTDSTNTSLEDCSGVDIHSYLCENGNDVSILGRQLSTNTYLIGTAYNYPEMLIERDINCDIDNVRQVFDSIVKGGNK